MRPGGGSGSHQYPWVYLRPPPPPPPARSHLLSPRDSPGGRHPPTVSSVFVTFDPSAKRIPKRSISEGSPPNLPRCSCTFGRRVMLTTLRPNPVGYAITPLTMTAAPSLRASNATMSTIPPIVSPESPRHVCRGGSGGD